MLEGRSPDRTGSWSPPGLTVEPVIPLDSFEKDVDYLVQHLKSPGCSMLIAGCIQCVCPTAGPTSDSSMLWSYSILGLVTIGWEVGGVVDHQPQRGMWCEYPGHFHMAGSPWVSYSKTMVLIMTIRIVGWLYLVGSHCEWVDITLLWGIAIWKAKLWWIQQFWGHVTDNAWPGCWCAAWLCDSGVSYDTHNPEVPKTCSAILSDQDVSLDRTGIGVCSELRDCSMLTGLISLCTISSECRWSRPQAAAASYREVLDTVVYLYRLWRPLTSCNRLTFWFSLMYSMIFPFGNQGLMMQNENNVSETPRKGNTFECEMYFHSMISR